ncbi:MAG: ParA family protein [Clostridia bacterium]|nr:ParA family protein [Clostridia bacterium]MBQ3554066.1 ParA family protein [Clostridia bacterium]
MGKVIIVANQKGGVGKTTTTVNLSACLSDAKKKVLVIDMDPQGNTTSGLGIDSGEVESTIYEVLIGGEKIMDAIIPTDYKNLDICPSGVNLAGAEVEMVGISGREKLLQSAIDSIRDKYDFMIIDCPPSLGLITLNAFVAADSVLVPIQCEYYALEGLSQLTKTIKNIKKSLNEKIQFEGILLTMFDARTNLSIQVAEEVKKFFPDKMFKSVIPRNVRLSEAPSFGQPIIVYDRHSKGAESYISLAKEVIKNNRGWK